MRTLRTTTLVALLLTALALPLAPATADDATTHHHVEPGASIQDALDAAQPGDTVHVHAGTYHEALWVTTPDITITGDGAGATVLDGTNATPPDVPSHDHGLIPSGHGHDQSDGIHITADDVTVQDLTVRDFPGDGVEWTDVVGFYAYRVHVIANGYYGLNAYESRIGGFFDSYGTEHADSAFYVGEIDSCQCVLDNVTAEGNLIGYSGTAGSHVTIRDSTFRDNAAGIVPNVLVSDHHDEPQLHLYVHDNLIVDNNNETASEKWHFSGSVHVPAGLGIVIAGGSHNLVTDNVITGHTKAGVAIAWLFTEPSFNTIVDNTMDNPATDAHPKAVDILWDGGGINNCFEENTRPDGSRATFDGGTYWNTVGRPGCDAPNAGVPSATAFVRLASLLVMGCEPGEQLDYHSGCHVEGAYEHDHGY